MITVVSKDDLEASHTGTGKMGALNGPRWAVSAFDSWKLPKEAQLEIIGRTLH